MPMSIKSEALAKSNKHTMDSTYAFYSCSMGHLDIYLICIEGLDT